MDNPIENENKFKEKLIDFKNITFDYMFNYMYYKYGAIIVTIVLIILIFVILIPFINLDYHADLCERIENLNKLCLYNHKDNNLPIKNTYLWNFCNYLYDYKDLDEQLKSKTPSVIDENLIKLYEIGDKVKIDDDIKNKYSLEAAEIDNTNKVNELETYLKKIKDKFDDIETANDNINKLEEKETITPDTITPADETLKNVIGVIKNLCSDNFNIDTFDLVLNEIKNKKYKFFKKDNYDILVKFDENYNFEDLKNRAAAEDVSSSDEADEKKQKLDELAKKINDKSGNTKDHLTDVFSEKNRKLYNFFNYTSDKDKQLHEKLESLFYLQKKLKYTKKYLKEYHEAVKKLDEYVQSQSQSGNPIESATLASEHELDLNTMYEISKVICANKEYLNDLSGTYCDNYPKLEDYNPEFNTEKEVILNYYSAVNNRLSRKEDIINTNIGNIIISLNNNYEYYKTNTFAISIFAITLVIIAFLTGIINFDKLKDKSKYGTYGFLLFLFLILIGIILNTLYMQYSKYSTDDDEAARNWKKLILDKKDNTSEQGIIEDFIAFHGLTAPVILGIVIGYGWWRKRNRPEEYESIKYLILARDILFFILLLTIASYATLYGIFNETKNYNGGDEFENKTMKIKDTISQLYRNFSLIKYKVFLTPFIVANSFTTPLLFGLLIWFFIHFNDDFNFNTFILYGSILIFIFFVIIVVFFGLSVKKFSEIYSPNDTNCYAYIMTIVELDYIINKKPNQYIKNIFESINSDNIKIDDIILTDKIINKIEDLKKDNIVLDYKYADDSLNYIPLTLTSFDDGKLITLKNLECLYNDKKLIKNNYNDGKNFNDNIDRIKEEIADLTRFKYAYIFLLTILLFILSKLLKYNFTYIAFSIIAIILICLFIYKIQNQLKA